MKKILLIAILALATVSASAAEVTLQYNQAHLKAVQSLVARINAERVAAAEAAGEDPAGVDQETALTYIQKLFTAKLDAIVRQELARKKAELIEAYEAADSATKTEVETHLNVTP